MAIVGFHAGKLSAGESLATAFARALGMTTRELNKAFSPHNQDGPEVWPLMLEKLNDLAAARGGCPITENGSLILEPRQGDDQRNGFDVLDELYQEMPEEMKKSYHLRPFLADYIKAISADQDNRTQR